MGLLDGMFSEDPQKQAMMAMALGLLGGSGHSNKNFGADLGAAGQQGLLAYSNQRALQAKLAEEKQQQEMRAMQMQQMQRQQQDDTAIRGAYSRNMVPGMPQMQPNDMETPSGPPGPSSMNIPGLRNDLMAAGPAGFGEAAKIAAMHQKDIRTFKPGESAVDMSTGKSIYSSPSPPHFVDAGDSVIPVDPNTGKPIGAPIKKNMSPDAKASNAVAWANYGKPTYQEGASGPVAVSPTKGGGLSATPVTLPNGVAMPAKLPDSVKKEVADIDSQIAIVRGGMDAAKSVPSAFGMPRGLATMAGTIPETIAGLRNSPEERQARAYVFNVVSGVIKERAGSAQTPQELQRLRSFLPNEVDNDKQIADKLKSFEKYLSDKRGAYNGSKPSGGASGGWGIKAIE